MSHRVGAELSSKIAAIAPVGGPLMLPSIRPSRPVSVMHFHGTTDDLAPFEGGRGKGTSNVPAFLRPTFRSVQYTIDKWVAANKCKPVPETTALPNRSDDGMTCEMTRYVDGKDGSEVVLVAIKNGGHTWPGQPPLAEMLGRSTRDISANDMMWDFFKRHSLPQKPPAPTEAKELE